MELDLIFENYPNSVFLVKPIIKNQRCVDFTYMYINTQFARFLGRTKNELLNHNFSDYFPTGENIWYDLFYDTVTNRKYNYVIQDSPIIGKKLACEVFYVEPNMVCCIIQDYRNSSDDIKGYSLAEILHKAYYDELTGLYNRFYIRKLESEVLENHDYGIAMIDINGLKKINDTKGHNEGDKLIIEVTRELQVSFDHSYICRYGGDEFLILSPNSTKEQFERMCNKLLAYMNKKKTASVGYFYNDMNMPLQEAIAQADKLMYIHKAELKKN